MIWISIRYPKLWDFIKTFSSFATWNRAINNIWRSRSFSFPVISFFFANLIRKNCFFSRKKTCLLGLLFLFMMLLFPLYTRLPHIQIRKKSICNFYSSFEETSQSFRILKTSPQKWNENKNRKKLRYITDLANESWKKYIFFFPNQAGRKKKSNVNRNEF